MIGIIGAMDVEVSNIIDKIQNVNIKKIGIYTYYQGLLEGKEVVLLKSGIGKVSSAVGTSLMIENYHPEVIINTGIAGGVAPLHTKDLCLASCLTYGDVDATVFDYALGQVPQMPQYYLADTEYLNKIKNVLNDMGYAYKEVLAVTSDSFITSLDMVNIPNKGNIICEMEGASIAQACHILNTKFVSLRYISDIINSDEHVKNYFEFEKEMANMSSNILIEVIKRI